MNRKQKHNRRNYKYAFVAFMMCLLYLPVTLRAENDVREKNGANLSASIRGAYGGLSNATARGGNRAESYM